MRASLLPLCTPARSPPARRRPRATPARRTTIDGLVSIDVAAGEPDARHRRHRRRHAAATRATGTFNDGHSADITAQVLFAVADVGLGAFAGAGVHLGPSTTAATPASPPSPASVVGMTAPDAADEAALQRPGLDRPARPIRAASSAAPTRRRWPRSSSIRTTACSCRRTSASSRSTGSPPPAPRSSRLRFANGATDVEVYLGCTNPTAAAASTRPTRRCGTGSPSRTAAPRRSS